MEQEAQAILIPCGLFNRMMGESSEFRYRVLASYGKRLDDLMMLVEEVAFRRMDQRLEEWLTQRRLRFNRHYSSRAGR
ncbi:hypothetical protein [Oceanisphaera pacifica]|uniref:Uncharacterized protein n=1 Tax=Oceanisphaera pacifica TaxID=2818389 RepID=A0ABS3NC57_9GAMM|nr:hypothetical protein [Oceanisphaera pacifica]MBO1518181.1 hypothetical protein [Oceanisphaera pacifica]